MSLTWLPDSPSPLVESKGVKLNVPREVNEEDPTLRSEI